MVDIVVVTDGSWTISTERMVESGYVRLGTYVRGLEGQHVRSPPPLPPQMIRYLWLGLDLWPS
jgi:hypothetical protein